MQLEGRRSTSTSPPAVDRTTQKAPASRDSGPQRDENGLISAGLSDSAVPSIYYGKQNASSFETVRSTEFPSASGVGSAAAASVPHLHRRPHHTNMDSFVTADGTDDVVDAVAEEAEAMLPFAGLVGARFYQEKEECLELELPSRPHKILLLRHGCFSIRLESRVQDNLIAKLEVDGCCTRCNFRLMPFQAHTIRETRVAVGQHAVPLTFDPTDNQLQPIQSLDDVDASVGCLRILFFQAHEVPPSLKWDWDPNSPVEIITMEYGYIETFARAFPEVQRMIAPAAARRAVRVSYDTRRRSSPAKPNILSAPRSAVEPTSCALRQTATTHNAVQQDAQLIERRVMCAFEKHVHRNMLAVQKKGAPPGKGRLPSPPHREQTPPSATLTAIRWDHHQPAIQKQHLVPQPSTTKVVDFALPHGGASVSGRGMSNPLLSLDMMGRRNQGFPASSNSGAAGDLQPNSVLAPRTIPPPPLDPNSVRVAVRGEEGMGEVPSSKSPSQEQRDDNLIIPHATEGRPCQQCRNAFEALQRQHDAHSKYLEHEILSLQRHIGKLEAEIKAGSGRNAVGNSRARRTEAYVEGWGEGDDGVKGRRRKGGPPHRREDDDSLPYDSIVGGNIVAPAPIPIPHLSSRSRSGGSRSSRSVSPQVAPPNLPPPQPDCVLGPARRRGQHAGSNVSSRHREERFAAPVAFVDPSQTTRWADHRRNVVSSADDEPFDVLQFAKELVAAEGKGRLPSGGSNEAHFPYYHGGGGLASVDPFAVRSC